MIKLAVFDFDGTIADSFEVSLQIAAELLGRPRLSKNEIEIFLYIYPVLNTHFQDYYSKEER